MPRVSLIDGFLSAEEQAKLAAFLNAHPTLTVDDFRRELSGRGLEVSRPTAHRAKRKLEDMGRRLRESRMLMDSIAGDVDELKSSRRGRALIEVTRTLVFEFQQALLDGGAGDLAPRDFAFLTRTLKDLLQATSIDQDIGIKSAEQAKRRAAEAVSAEARKHGVSDAVIAALRGVVEGDEP